MIVETDKPADIQYLTSVFAAFEFKVEPVVDVMDAAAVEVKPSNTARKTLLRRHAVRSDCLEFHTAAVAFVAAAAPARTQPKAPAFVQSEQAFNSLPIDTRITFQVLLTAEGYWPAVPNVNYSGRLYDAVRRFQSDHGFRPTGMLNAAELDKLLDVATPMLKMWEFQGVGHPDRGRPIWVPVGLGLQVERVNGGIISERWRGLTGLFPRVR
jgi:Putative peptidoglycan binding domain